MPTGRRDAPVARAVWFFEAMSSDGARAFLRELKQPGQGAPRWRVVAIATNTVLADAALEAFHRVHTETSRRPDDGVPASMKAPEFEADLVRAAKMLEPFPFGAMERLAVSPASIVFAAGDGLYLADRAGRVKKRIAKEPANSPRFSRDGGVLLFSRQNGSVDGVSSKYELFATSGDAAETPKRVELTAELRDGARLSADGKAMRAVVSHEPAVKTCVVEVSLVAPIKARPAVCLDGGEKLVGAELSPTGRWAAISTYRVESPSPSPSPSASASASGSHVFRLRVVNVDRGTVDYDGARPLGSVLAVSDSGLVALAPAQGEPVLRDVPAGSTRPAPAALKGVSRAFFRSPTELCVNDGPDLRVVDLAAP